MKVDKKNIYIVLFSIWVTISGVLFAVGNNFIKIIGAISLLIIIFLILIVSTSKVDNQDKSENDIVPILTKQKKLACKKYRSLKCKGCPYSINITGKPVENPTNEEWKRCAIGTVIHIGRWN